MQETIWKGKRLLALALLFSCPLLFAAWPAGAAPPEGTVQGAGAKGPVFPLRVGSYWVYQAMLSWGSADSSGTNEKLMEWKMTVDRVIRRGKLLAAVVTGFPRDLDDYDGKTKPTRSLIVESGGAKFYWIPPASFKDALASLENSGASLDSLTGDDNLFLEWPLAEGGKFCGITGMIRTDGFYCWVAGEPKAAELGTVKGVPTSASTAYPVRFLTVENSTSFDFVPGVGITRYSYQVHGSATDIELRLMEFHPGAH